MRQASCQKGEQTLLFPSVKACRIGTSPVTSPGACQYPCPRQRVRCSMAGSITTYATSRRLPSLRMTGEGTARNSGTSRKFTILLARILSTTTTSSCRQYVLASIQNTSFQTISLQGATLCSKTKRYQRVETGILG